MMDEKEFDQKIRESALRHESRMEKPLWNKQEVWNRVHSGLGKKNRFTGWKAAAVILILLSTGCSYAIWNNFRQYRQEKEKEFSKLQQQIDQNFANQNNTLFESQMLIQKQNRDIDSLKKQIKVLEKNFKKNESNQTVSIKKEEKENQKKSTNQDKLIDSLQNQLSLVQKTFANKELTRISQDTQITKPESSRAVKETPGERHIYLISNHDKPQNTKKERGFKIGILGLTEDQNTEYQSEHSIFKK